MKQIIVLVGLKGAGKSTIGHLIETELGIAFLRVEPLFLELRAKLGSSHPQFEQCGFERVLESVREVLLHHDVVCFETTGASTHVPWLLAELAGIGRVHIVHIIAGNAQCLERIHGRDASIHIPVSDDQVDRINAIAAEVTLPWSAEIDNGRAFDRHLVLSTVSGLLRTS